MTVSCSHEEIAVLRCVAAEHSIIKLEEWGLTYGRAHAVMIALLRKRLIARVDGRLLLTDEGKEAVELQPEENVRVTFDPLDGKFKALLSQDVVFVPKE